MRKSKFSVRFRHQYRYRIDLKPVNTESIGIRKFSVFCLNCIGYVSVMLFSRRENFVFISTNIMMTSFLVILFKYSLNTDQVLQYRSKSFNIDQNPSIPIKTETLTGTNTDTEKIPKQLYWIRKPIEM